MKITDLPEEITALFAEIPDWQHNIGDDVVPILLKLWWGKPLDERELAQLLTPDEVAAVWSVTHKRPIKSRTVRDQRRFERIQEAKSSASGRQKLYTVRGIAGIEIKDHPGKRPSDVPPKYPSWSPEYRRAKRQAKEEAA